MPGPELAANRDVPGQFGVRILAGGSAGNQPGAMTVQAGRRGEKSLGCQVQVAGIHGEISHQAQADIHTRETCQHRYNGFPDNCIRQINGYTGQSRACL